MNNQTYIEFKDIPDQTTFLTTNDDHRLGVHINNSDDAMYCRHYFSLDDTRKIYEFIGRWLADFEG